MSTLTLRVSPPLDKRLTRLSKRRNLSKSDLVRIAIERYLRVEEFEELRAIAVPIAQAQGIFTDDDVFRRLSVDLER
jgi:predicted transcriptional regulator